MLDKLTNYLGLTIISAGVITLLGIGLLQGLFYLAALIPPLPLDALRTLGPVGIALPICALTILIGIVILIIELNPKKVGIEEVVKK